MNFTCLQENFSQKLYRLKLSNPNFWDNVKVQNKELRDHILEWLSALKYYRNISIDKFSVLFTCFDEIVFPIKITGFRRHLQIKDNSGNEYYMWYLDYNHHKFDKYGIGSRANGFDKEFIFKLTDNNKVVLHELFLLKLNEHNNNSDKSVSFYYNSNTKITTVVLESGKRLHLKITYPEHDCKMDELISDYLFSLADEFICIDDIFFVLEYMYTILKPSRDKYSLYICSYDGFEENKQILSELRLLDGIVTSYSFTMRSDTMICLNQVLIPEELEKFILIHKNEKIESPC